MDSVKYDVVLNGVRVGYESELVAQSLAKLFKIPTQKASALLQVKKTIKKNVSSDVAERYKKRLRSIGVDVVLHQLGAATIVEAHSEKVVESQPVKPSTHEVPESVGADESSGLSLVSMTNVAAAPIEEMPHVAPASRMICPKCQLEQVKSSQCIGCGVYVDKINKPNVSESSNATAINRHEVKSFSASSELSILVYLVPIGAALLGAFIWYGIAVAFDYELGLVAWLVGGMIGFSAAIAGGEGDSTGVVCALLLVVSIFAGKYMAMSSFKASFEQEMNAITQMDAAEFEAAFNMEQADLDAAFGGEIPEIDEEAMQQAFDFAKEQATTLVDNMSVMDLVAESLGFIDLIFIILGAGTAFRLGRGEE